MLQEALMNDFSRMTEESLWDKLAESSGSERPEILQQLGWRAIQREKWGEAISILEEAKAAYEQIGCSSDVRMCLHWIARCAGNMSNSEMAIAEHINVLNMLQEQGPLDEFGAKTVDAIGCEYRDAGQQKKAGEYFGQAARLHDSNQSKYFAENSARKWIETIRRVGNWVDMLEATDIVLRNSTNLESHIHARVGQILAACHIPDSGYDIDDLLAKCARLDTAHADEEMSFEISLAKIAVLQLRGKLAEAESLALSARDHARACDDTNYQAQFIIAAAQTMLDRKPEAAVELLLVAQDLGEVLSDRDLLDHVGTSLMHIREARRSQPQPTLWDAATSNT
jgi:tetratricopeptide (TPR) repeat protein